MVCPLCTGVELQIHYRDNVEVDVCPKCRGVWLDRGELDKIIERQALDQVDLGEKEYEYHGYRKNRKRSSLGEFFDFG